MIARALILFSCALCMACGVIAQEGDGNTVTIPFEQVAPQGNAPERPQAAQQPMPRRLPPPTPSGNAGHAPAPQAPPMPVPAPQAPAVSIPGLTVPAPGAAGPSGAQAPSAESVEVLAFQATKEGRADKQIDDDLKGLGKVFADMPYDTFHRVASQKADALYGQETAVPLNDRYTLYLKPVGKQENGQVAMESRIAMNEGGKTLNAIHARGVAVPGRALLFRGLEMTSGELGVIVRLGGGDQQGQGGESGEQDEQKESQEAKDGQNRQNQQGDQQQEGKQKDWHESPKLDEQDEKELAKQEKENQQGEGEDESAVQAGDESAAQEDKDTDTIEALLKSLEDQDRRQQHALRQNRRESVKFMGDWW